MKRVLIFFWAAALSFMGTTFLSKAQNNIYEIDDECYELFAKAESLIGTDELPKVNEELLKTALAKGDEKARTLYYVVALKHLAKVVPSIPAGSSKLESERIKKEHDDKVYAAFEELKAVSRETGYKQYYYYAYSLMRNYYYNARLFGRTMEIILEMRNIAIEEDDDYGKWTGDRYLADLYLAQSDFVSAKIIFPEIIKIRETSEDPTIKRQSLGEIYLNFAECFPVASDSTALLTKLALNSELALGDTVKAHMFLASRALARRNVAEYKKYRDLTLASSYKNRLTGTIDDFFRFADMVQTGEIDKSNVASFNFKTHRERKFLAEMCDAWGRYEAASKLHASLEDRMERKLSEINEMNLAELEARYEVNYLNAEVEEKNRQIERTRWIIVALATLVLLGLIAALQMRNRNLRNINEKDEKMIADLREANEKVLFADEAKTRFIQNMTHEIRTPLNAITGFSQLLSLPDGMFEQTEKEEFAGHIINNTKMLTMLLDDIMHISASDTKGYTIKVEEGECEHICREAMSAAEHRLQPGVQMLFTPKLDLPFSFSTDPLRVQQVLTNLLTNACKHTTKGEVRLGCSLEENPGMVTFFVEDTGSGIPADQAERIFERFVKLNDFVQGTGLGLSICRDIATRMGGNVWLDTSYSGGSRFVFTVPREAQ